MISKRLQSNKVAERVSFLTISIMLVVLVLVSVAAVLSKVFNLINALTLVAVLISTLVLYMLANLAVMQRYVLKPLANLTESVSRISSGTGTENVVFYGGDRKDEIGNLSRTIQHMWDTLRDKNLDVQKLAEAERDTHELNQALIDAAPYVISLWDENGKLISVSKQAIKMFEISDPQVIVNGLFTISPESQPCGTPTPIKAAEQINRTYTEEYVRFDWMHKTPDGKPLPAECIFKRFTHRGKDMLLSYTRDLREIKAAEEKEREAQAALMYREMLLDTIKQAAEILLTANENNTMAALVSSMEIVGRCADADRVQIWRNEEIDGKLYFAMGCEWQSEFSRQKKGDHIGLKAPYSSRPGWMELFMRGERINTPVSKLPPDDAAFLGYYNMVSVVILPLFLNDEFYGFFNIADCRQERTFTKDEVDIFTSAGLMFTNVFYRNAQRDLIFTDALTGIRNRRCLLETGEQELQGCIKKNMDFAVIMIDIDLFKFVNDVYGHFVGDAVLKILTARVSHVLKHDTLLARYGGEEFVVTLPGVDHESAISTAWRIQKAIEASTFLIEDSLEISVTASFGVASKTAACTTLSDVIDKADKALYQAKKDGRNTVADYRSAVISCR